MADFDEILVEQEVTMLGGMIDEIEKSIASAHDSKRKLVAVRTALAGAIGVDLPTEDNNQLDLTFVVDGKKTEVEKDED